MRTRTLLLAALLATLLGPPVHAQTAPQAEQFLHQIYAAYPHSNSFHGKMYVDAKGASIFTPSLHHLIDLDRRNTPKGDAPNLDFDPICACQDDAGMSLTQLTVSLTDPQHATANVRLHFPEPATMDLHLDLLWTPTGWRIDDIHTKDVPSLRKLFTNH